MSLMIFEWREDDYYGEWGWLAKGRDNFNVTRPDLMAHDCIEHFPRGDQHGPAADELLALGARWYIRVEGGWFCRQNTIYSPETSFGHEINVILTAMRNEGWDLKKPPTPKPDGLYVNDILAEGVFFANEALDDDDDTEEYDEQQDLIQDMGKWLQIGYHACIQRYRERRPEDIMFLSECLVERAKKFSRGEEGDRLLVRVHEKDMDCSIKRVSDFPYW